MDKFIGGKELESSMSSLGETMMLYYINWGVRAGIIPAYSI
jgi:hypothetical protein